MYQMIRSGTGFDPVIMVSPPDATPESSDAKFYRYASWQIGDETPGIFHEIDKERALSYFHGIADGIGFEDPPEEPFPSLEAALAFVKERQNEWARAREKERKARGEKPLTPEERRALYMSIADQAK